MQVKLITHERIIITNVERRGARVPDIVPLPSGHDCHHRHFVNVGDIEIVRSDLVFVNHYPIIRIPNDMII